MVSRDLELPQIADLLSQVFGEAGDMKNGTRGVLWAGRGVDGGADFSGTGKER